MSLNLINPFRFGVAGPTDIGSWKEVGRSSTITSDAITVSSLPYKKYYVVLAHTIHSGSTDQLIRVGNGSVDTGTNYARRYSIDGAADGTLVSNGYLGGTDGSSTQAFSMYQIRNSFGQEKFSKQHSNIQLTAGAANPPRRFEQDGKWANTTAPINVIEISNGVGTFTSGEVVVLGWDPVDTHTTTDNFWQELGSHTLTSDVATHDIVFSSIKKYIWASIACPDVSGATNLEVQYGSTTIDTGTNYAQRHSNNGGADGTSASYTANQFDITSGTKGRQMQFYIINVAAQEKLGIAHVMDKNTAGAANVPSRSETIGKWVNTSNQMDRIRFKTSNSVNLPTGTRMKVWGHD